MARLEVGHTRISPPLSRILILLFLLTIYTVPFVQHVAEIRDYRAGKRPSPLPQVYDVFSLLPSALKAPGDPALSGILSRFFEVNRTLLKEMQGFEDALDDQAVIGKWIRPKVQYVLTTWLGAGNEKAYCGRQTWLFYRPGIDYLLGPPFLEPSQMRKRETSGSEWIVPTEPDPRKAIFHLHEQLSKRGIALIVMPAPEKAMIHPEKLSGRYDQRQEELQNPSYAQFRRDMAQRGVLVFDAAPILMSAKGRDGREQYLEGDTHWRPEAVERVADELGVFIRKHVPLPDLPSPGYKAEKSEVTNLGDLAVMLNLPAGQRVYPEEKVPIRRIADAAGGPWQPRKSADVLVLGDSFSNIYSLGAMGWGEAAGFVEQLSFVLQRPLDRIARNDDGAFAAREILAGELARGRDRLEGKRLVVYQFAIRELAVGNWKRVDLKKGDPLPLAYLTLPPGGERVVQGKIEAVSAVPRPGTVPYKDHVMAIHLTDLESDGRPLTETDAMVYMRSMTDNEWTAAARYRPGDAVTLRLKAWSDVAERYERINRTELDDTALQLVEPCWGDAVKN